METSDVEDDAKDESILYDLTVHAEWKPETDVFRRAVGKDNISTISRLASSTQRTGWTVLRSLGLPIQTASPCHLPPGLVKLVNCKINWHIAVGGEGQVAVLQDQCIEIRTSRDEYASVAGRATIQRDPYPQWRQLAWSSDNTMLACCYSSGKVDIFDIVGGLLHTIPGKEVSSTNSKLPVDLSEAVAALIFTENKSDGKSLSELLVINYHGSLHSYKVDRDGDCILQHSYVFNKCYPRGISCVEYHAEAGLLYVGGCGQMEEGGSVASKEGLTAWRRLSDYPHYKMVTDLAEDLSRSQKARFLRMPSLSYMKADTSDGIFKMSLSPSGKYLATVHYSGKLNLWTVPGLKLQKTWTHEQQPFCDEFSPEFTDNPQLRKQVKDLVNTKNLMDVNWWSNEAMILARGTGAVTVSSIKSLRNLLGGHPEWFEPAPKLSSMYNGGFLGLEVECRFPKKRRLVSLSETEEEEEESDQEEVGLVSKSWGVAKQCMHYVTDMDRFKPPKKKPRMVNRTYRLVCLKSTTPDELFARKLENEEYGEAKLLAQKYGLDTDLVYQKQWRKSPVELASIQDYLSKISKRAWVLHECTERMSDKIDAMKGLLEFGLRGTDLEALIMIGKGENQGRFILCDPEDGIYDDMELDDYDPEKEAKMEERRKEKINELMKQVDFQNLTLEQRELLRARKKLLQYLYRLKTYESILGGVSYAAERYDCKFFEKFRSQNIVEAAVNYAQDSDWQALETILTFHSTELLPHRLAILSHFPETTCPSEYKTLLPEVRESRVTDWQSDCWVKPDWIQLEPCKSALEPVTADLGEYLYEDQPELLKYRGKITPSTLTGWYQYRAKEIEKFSRQTEYALELIQLGIERGVQGLELILDDLVTMEMLVYSCHVDDSLTFQQLQDMTNYQKLELIMSKSSDEMYSKNLRRWMVPFLKQCEGGKQGNYNNLLREYIVTTSKKDLSNCLQVFEASKTHLPNPVIIKQADLMSFAMEAVYSCERDDQLDLAMSILKCLPQRGYGSDTREIQKLHSLVDKMEHHLNAAKILEDNGIKKPVHFIKDTESKADEAEQLMIRLTRMMGKNDEVSEAMWSKLHGEMIELQDKVYRCISPALCHEIFVNGLLCSSNLKYIQLAGKMVERAESESHKPTPLIYNMQTKVPYHRAIELVLSAAREYFNSSANLSDMCIGLASLEIAEQLAVFVSYLSQEGVTARSIAAAMGSRETSVQSISEAADWSCLNLIQDSPAEILEENDLIASLSLLEEFGLTILPLQVRLYSDRVELVKSAVQSKRTAYKNKQKLLRLGHLLRIKAKDRIDRDDQVLHILASAAMKERDFPYVYDACKQLMSDGHGAAWDVCVDLAMHEDFRNVGAKVDLLSFAVTFCSPDMIEPVLQARALLETQVLFEGISSQVEDQSNDHGKRSSHSPFSATAAIQQTQQILTSTKQTTKAVLSTVTDAKWWQGTMKRLKQPAERQISYDMKEKNKKLNLQACHPFYEDVIENCYSNLEAADFRHIESHMDPSVQMSENLLRTAQLEEMLTEGEKSHTATELLLQLANDHFSTDNTLSLAYLLALKEPTDAEYCFSEHPKTDISLQLAIYYYALQLYAAMKPCDIPELSPLYIQHPVKVMNGMKNLITNKKDIDWPVYVIDIVEKMKNYIEMLEDFTQARILRSLGRGIDIDRFTSDTEYKQETILGLTMSNEESMYKIAVSLAERHNIALWEVHMAHVEFLFADSGLSVDEIESRINHLNLLDSLRSRSEEFCDRMKTYVYPSLDGRDIKTLLYYYTVMLGSTQPLEGCLTADQHVKLLKKLMGPLNGVDYKALMSEEVNVIDVLSPCLSSENITNVAKLAKQIPDRRGGYLDASIVYCTWAVKYFWEGAGKAEPDTAAGWLHRYEACSEFIHKLQPVQVQQFVEAILFVKKSREKLDVDCRQAICKRILKYSRASKKKRQLQESVEGEMTFETLVSVLNIYLKHLETLSSPVTMEMMQSKAKVEQDYVESYDLSKGDMDKLHMLSMKIILDGEVPLEVTQRLLSVFTVKTWKVKTIVKDALDHLLNRWSPAENEIEVISDVEPLVSLEKIVVHVQEHVEKGGDLITSEDILSKLRPFCSDASVDVQPRLDVLYILEKSFKLTEEDSLLLTLYRTQAIVHPIWTSCEVKEDNVKSPESRQQLFSQLLHAAVARVSDSSGETEFSALCKLLKLWPKFPAMGSDTESPWILLFNAMTTSGYHANINLVIDTVKETKDISLSKESTKKLYEIMLEKNLCTQAVKLCLINGQTELLSLAIETLSSMPKIEDDEVIVLILKHRLVPELVHSCHYPIIIQYILGSQDGEGTSHDYLNVATLANQLKECGFEAEAGSLSLQDRSTHPLLQTFGSALGSLGKWFK